MSAEEAEVKYSQHDWENDEEWKKFLRNVTYAADDGAEVLEKLKRKYFKRLDSNLETKTTTTSQSQSKPEPEKPQPQPQQPQSEPSQPQPQQSRPQPQAQPQPQQQKSQPQQQQQQTRAKPFKILSIEGASFYLNTGVVICSILYLIPLGGFSVMCYRTALLSAMICLTIGLYQSGTLSRSLISREGVGRFMADTTGQFWLYCLIHFFFSPVLFILVPLATVSVYNVLMISGTPSTANLPSFLKSHEEKMKLLTSPQGVQSILLNNALIENLTSFLLLMLMFTPTGSFLHFFLHVQYLRLRFKTSNHSKTAWAIMNQKFRSIVYHRFCPSIVANLYEKLITLIHRYGSS